MLRDANSVKSCKCNITVMIQSYLYMFAYVYLYYHKEYFFANFVNSNTLQHGAVRSLLSIIVEHKWRDMHPCALRALTVLSCTPVAIKSFEEVSICNHNLYIFMGLCAYQNIIYVVFTISNHIIEITFAF